MKTFLRLTAIAIALISVTLSAFAQTATANISGHVVDQSKGVVVQANVELINQQTNVVVTTRTNGAGNFVFANVEPGTFTIAVEAAGYKEIRKVNLELSASDNLDAGTLTLQVGQVSQTVTVSSDITPLQTTSSERSGTLDTAQMDNLLAIGRDAFALTRTIPGIVGSEGAASISTTSTPTVNGVNSEYNGTSYDGGPGNLGGSATVYTPQNLDAVKEVTVLTANYTAENGNNAGSDFMFVTKSGTQQFHGGLYEYFRNEDLNANSFFNKYVGNEPRARYRYNNFGGTIGGPIFIPNHFNSSRNKLFFFVSIDEDPIKTPDGLKYYTIPTQAQINGDFSQTYNQGTTAAQGPATLIHIRQPGQPLSSCPTNSSTPGSGCFSGNVIPANLLNAQMQALLQIIYNNTLGLNPQNAYTNLALSANNYNYITNNSSDRPVYQEIFRVDYFPTQKLHMFVRGDLTKVNDNGFSSSANDLPWLMKVNYQNSEPNFVADAIYTFTPTLVNELNVGTGGWSENQLYNPTDLAKVKLGAGGFNLPSLYPGVNPLNLFPATSFGPTDTANYGWDSRFPMADQLRQYTGTDKITKIIGSHTLKAGISLETDAYLQTNHNRVGTFNTGVNTSNPNDSNFGYSNALLGNLNTYSQDTQLEYYKPRDITPEWYLQDSWKVNDKLNLDYGVRFSYSLGQRLHSGDNFNPSLYSRSAAPALYQYNASGTATDPTTGIATYPKAYAGLLVPGTGNINNGILYVNTPGYPQGTVSGNGFLAAPRVGFAYSTDRKTVIRGGFGTFYNVRMRNGQEGDLANNAPTTNGPTQYYSSVNPTSSNYYASPGASTLNGPFSIGHAIPEHIPMVYTYNASLGVQRQLPSGVVLDVAYVGTFGRHVSDYTPINEVPYGAEFLLSSQSPAGGTLPDNFFRPYPGLGTINMQNFNLTSNYNSLQVKITRRLHGGLEYGAAYTYSKAMDYTDSYNGTVALYQNLRYWNYGPAGYDVKHNLVVNYLWALPKASRLWDNFATRGILDNWQISGIASYLSGEPGQVGDSFSNGQNITGGGDGARIVVTCDPSRRVPRKTGTFNEWFNTGCVESPLAGAIATTTTPPVQYSTGSGTFERKVGYFLPGDTNFDTALFKNVPFEEGKYTVQFRLETYNTFNHAEFNGVNNSATFANANSQGTSNAPTNTTFGQLSSTLTPRYLQLALRFDF